MAEPASGAPERRLEDWLASLRQGGANRLDPVRFRFLEALAGRLPTQPAAVRELLAGTLATALAEYQRRFELRQAAAEASAGRLAAQFPAASEELQKYCREADFAGLERRRAELERPAASASLAELGRPVACPDQGPVAAGGAAETARFPAAVAGGGELPGRPGGELKALRYFRDTWSKLSVDQQLTQALAAGPDNAGPLNSHLLVLNTLTRLRELSPDYLIRLMSQLDALLWLDQAASGPASRKTLASLEAERKKKPPRPRSRSAVGA